MKVLAIILTTLAIWTSAPCDVCGAVHDDNLYTAYHLDGEHFGSLCQTCRENVWLPEDIQTLNHECEG